MVRIEELSSSANKHAMSLPTTEAEGLLGRLEIVDEQDDGPSSLPSLLSPQAAARLVEGLEAFALADVGSSRWLAQHQAMERLNLQAHQDAQRGAGNTEEPVVDAFVGLDKVSLLIHDLVLMDCWRQRLWPRLRPGAVRARATTRAYFVLFHEATAINLLEVLLFHPRACAAAGDALVDLVDYCMAQVSLLNSGELQQALLSTATESDSDSDTASLQGEGKGGGDKAEVASLLRARAEALAQRPADETLARQERELRFQVAVAAVGVLRCLAAQARADGELSLAVLGRMVHTHDLPLALVPLIENPPWTRCRRRPAGGGGTEKRWEKYVDFQWVPVAARNLMLLTKAEAQPWLALFHLLASPRVRERYHLHSFRKGQLLRVRRYLHEVLLDQLPVLADIRRFLDEVALLEVPEPTAGPAAFLLEQVAEVRAAILAPLGKGDGEAEAWCEAEAGRQLRAHFGAAGGDAGDPDLKALAGVYTAEWVDAMASAAASAGKEQQQEESGACGHCGKEAGKRCGRCQRAWYCSRDCQVAAWKTHKPACERAAREKGETE